MKNTILLLFVLNALFSNAAPEPIKKAVKLEVAKVVQSKKLAVILHQASEKEMNRMKPDEITLYKSTIATINSNLKFAVTQFWSLNQSVEFITPDQMKSIPGFATDYVILTVGTIYINGDVNQVGRVYLCFPDKIDAIKPIFYMDSPITRRAIGRVPLIEKVDLVSTLRMVHSHFLSVLDGKKVRAFNMEQMYETAGFLKTKTLLIDTRWLDKDFDQTQIKNYYPGAVEFCDSKRIEQVQFSRDNNYVFVHLMPVTTSGEMYTHYIIDVESAKVVSHSYINTGFMKVLVSERHLNNYWKFANMAEKKSGKTH